MLRKYSNKLNLNEFFIELSNEIYSIVKISDFPNYYTGNDIDIFCYNIKSFSKKVLEIGEKYVEDGFEIKVTNKEEDSQVYIDFYTNDTLEFRFDLYGKNPFYSKVKIKEGYFYSVIENSKALIMKYKGKEYNIYVPNDIDEMLIRYIEFREWYDLRPDKIKHLDYIVSSINDDASRIKFLDKLHAYTELPETLEVPKIKKINDRIYKKRTLVSNNYKIVRQTLERIFENVKGKNIGIYGTGEHTEVMLKMYEKLVGKIDFNLFFIDSNEQKWGKDYLNSKIYSPKDIESLNLYQIVISSFSYQDEIYNKIKEFEDTGINIVKIYKNNGKMVFIKELL